MTDQPSPDPAPQTPSHVTGDVFTGGKREINTDGGNYYENVNLPPPTAIDARRQLPSPPADFTGRAAELAELRAAAATGAAGIFGLRGQGGVGKTALALVLAHELKDRYPDAQIYLDLQGAAAEPLTPGAVMAHTLRAFAPLAQLPTDDAGLAAAYHSVLHGQRALLLFDNARDLAQVAPLIPPAGCLLLVTSRLRFTLPGLRPLNLDILPRADSIALLLAIAPRIESHADEIADLCDDLPLALRLAASALADLDNLTPKDYADRLATEQGRMKALDQVMASLALSYDLLDADLQAAWRALAAFVGDFDRPAAAEVLEMDDDAAGDALGGLLRYSMVEYDKDSQRYSLHDLARDAAGTRLLGDERASAERRHAAHYVQALAAAQKLYLEGGDKILAGLRLFDQERADIEAGQAWAAARAEQDEDAARLCNDYPNAGAYVLDLRQSRRERIGWMEAALAAARRLGNKAMEGGHLGNLGLAYADLGEPRRAIEYHNQALVISREIRDKRAEGQDLGNLGLAYAALGEPRRAIEFYEQVLAIMREIGDRRGEGQSLGSLGLAYADLGETRRAIEFYEQRLVIAREIGDRRGEGNALGSLGTAYAALGEPRRAIDFYEQWLVIAREIGDRRGEGAGLGNLGLAYADLGETNREIEYHEQDLAIAREIGDRRGEGQSLGNLGNAYYSLGETRRAIECYEQHRDIAREIGDRRGEADALGNLGNAYDALGAQQRAIDFYDEALAVRRAIGDRRGVGNALWNKSTTLDDLGQRADAIANAEAALRLFEQIEDPSAERVRRQVAEWKDSAADLDADDAD